MIKMSLTPISRVSLLGLKAKKGEEERQNKINEYVTDIYSRTVGIAANTKETCAYYVIPRNHGINGKIVYSEFHTTNIKEIIANLQDLFPNCLVEYKTLTWKDEKPYDISKIDEKTLPFINVKNSKPYIVIDWH